MPGEESTVSDRVTPVSARRERLLLYGCAALVVVAVLAPLARAGYALRTDMVFVPRQPLRWDLVVPIGTLPRAVPEDALVSLSALALPGWLAQRLALAGMLAAATIGAGRLVPAGRTLTRLVAALAYGWTPFVAERLLIGQWGLLICYAALPWLVGAARDLRLGRPRAGARLVLAAACASVTPTGGVIAVATTLVLAYPPRVARRTPPRDARRTPPQPASDPPALTPAGPPTSTPISLAIPVRPAVPALTSPAPTNPAPTNPALTRPAPTNPAPTNPALTRPSPPSPAGSSPHDPAGRRHRRHVIGVLAAVAALNAPWVVIAFGSPAIRISSPEQLAIFSARAENWAGALAALAGTGGIWNAQSVPASRSGPLVPVITLVLVGVAVFGFRSLERLWPEGTGTRMGRLAVGSLLVSAMGALPGVSDRLRMVIDVLPGGGIVRDGQKLLMPYVLCLALCLALGAERIAARVPPAGGRIVLAGFALLPVVALPDLAWGVGGKLRPIAYPAEWATVAAAVAAEPGPVLSLPLSAYRAYPWNPAPSVYDPAGRYLPSPVIVDDSLYIELGRGSTELIRGESTVVPYVRERLEADGPAADDGIRWVLVQHGSGGTVPATALAGLTAVHRGPGLDLYRNPDYHADGHRPLWGLSGYLLAGAVVAAAGWWRLAPRRRDG